MSSLSPLTQWPLLLRTSPRTGLTMPRTSLGNALLLHGLPGVLNAPMLLLLLLVLLLLLLLLLSPPLQLMLRPPRLLLLLLMLLLLL